MNITSQTGFKALATLMFLGISTYLSGGCASAPPLSSYQEDPVVIASDALSAIPDTFAVEIDPVKATHPPEDPAGRSLRLMLGDRPDLAQLDDMYRQALEFLSLSHYEAAEDLLFVLKDEAVALVPADTDSVALVFLSSLDRRVSLLAGVLAEDQALSLSVTADDSLLAAAYDNLRGLSFPDSLIPVSGGALSDIQGDLLTVDNDAVVKWIDYFMGKGRGSIQKWLDRKAVVDSLIYRQLDEAGLPRELIYLAAIESGFNPRARSGVGALGTWQFMAGTARHYHLRCDWWVDERQDPEMATRAAVTYLSQLYHHFGNWALVLAGYNTGEHRVDRAIRIAGHDDFWQLHLPWQTRNHIPKFIATARISEDPLAYGFEPTQDDKLGYDVIDVTDATDLGLIARCAGVDKSAVVALNPALLREATPPGQTDYPVRVPTGTGAKISNAALIHPGDRLLIPMPAELSTRARKRIAENGHYVPPSGYERSSYRVRSGDTLGGIARKLGVTLRHLRRVNNIHKTSLIRPGQRIYAYRPPQH